MKNTLMRNHIDGVIYLAFMAVLFFSKAKILPNNAFVKSFLLIAALVVIVEFTQGIKARRFKRIFRRNN